MSDFNTEVLGRIKSLQVKTTNSITAFAKKINMTQTRVNNHFRNDDKATAVSLDMVCSILQSYPEVSAEWLLRGEGEMFFNSCSEIDKSKKELATENLDLKFRLAELEREKLKVDIQVDALYDLIKKMTGASDVKP